jgi:hypothetical protein
VNGRLAVAVIATVLALPAAASPGEVREAVLLLDAPPADPASTARMLAVAREEVKAAWRVVPAAGLFELARMDPACAATTEARAAGDAIVAGVREGLRLFFDETAVERSQEVLSRAVHGYIEHPCLLAGRPSDRAEVCAGAVVLARILLPGTPEAAAAVARRLALVFAADEVAAQDVPPEMGRFFAGIRADVESVSATLEVEAGPGAAAAGASLWVDGREVAGGPPWSATVAAGSHEVALRLANGDAISRRVVTAEARARVAFDVVLAGALASGPEGSLVVSGGRSDAESVARRVSEVTGRSVLLARGGANGLSVAAVEPAGPGVDLLTMRPADPAGAVDVSLAADAPIVTTDPWPWPWVSAGLSAGLLAAAAGLNVAADRAASDVNAGQNRLAEWRAMRGSSIACYCLAAAGAASTVLLFVLKPPPRTRFVVGPSGVGASF